MESLDAELKAYLDLRFAAVHDEFRSVRHEIRAGDAETRRQLLATEERLSTAIRGRIVEIDLIFDDLRDLRGRIGRLEKRPPAEGSEGQP